MAKWKTSLLLLAYLAPFTSAFFFGNSGCGAPSCLPPSFPPPPQQSCGCPTCPCPCPCQCPPPCPLPAPLCPPQPPCQCSCAPPSPPLPPLPPPPCQPPCQCPCPCPSSPPCPLPEPFCPPAPSCQCPCPCPCAAPPCPPPCPAPFPPPQQSCGCPTCPCPCPCQCPPAPPCLLPPPLCPPAPPCQCNCRPEPKPCPPDCHRHPEHCPPECHHHKPPREPYLEKPQGYPTGGYSQGDMQEQVAAAEVLPSLPENSDFNQPMEDNDEYNSRRRDAADSSASFAGGDLTQEAISEDKDASPSNVLSNEPFMKSLTKKMQQQRVNAEQHHAKPKVTIEEIPPRPIPITQLKITNDTLCNNEELRRIMKKNINSSLNTSKRLVQLAAEERFGGQFDVICANNDFSYVTNTELYCQETKGDVSCYAYRQLR